jgi:hypothetical protein
MLHNLLCAKRDCAPEHIDQLDTEIYRVLGIDGPGAYALLEPDGRLMVWQTEAASLDDDGQRATYRSRIPLTAMEWHYISKLEWIDTCDRM